MLFEKATAVRKLAREELRRKDQPFARFLTLRNISLVFAPDKLMVSCEV